MATLEREMRTGSGVGLLRVGVVDDVGVALVGGLREAPVVDRPVVPDAAEMVRRIPHVLVVDDDPGTAIVVRSVLDTGVIVVGLPDVYQALDHLEREPVDLLLIELFLPGAGGVDLLRRLSRGPRPSRVVALTHATSIARIAPDVSVDEVIHKPVTPRELRAALDAALSEGLGFGNECVLAPVRDPAI